MIRLDKLISELNISKRSEAGNLIKKGLITVNGIPAKSKDEKVDEATSVISYMGNDYRYVKYRYFLLNKPQNAVCANADSKDRTVMDIFRQKYPQIKADSYFSMGRLDKDTVGLLIITNDGELSHRLLSPKYHVNKRYFVRLDKALDDNTKKLIEKGVYIEKDVLTKPAQIQIDWDNPKECYINISEGRFHQVKRMFGVNGLNVEYLKRVNFGNLELPEDLAEGDFIELNEEMVGKLTGENKQ